MIPWILLLLACVLLFVEFYLPSGVIAAIGAVFFLISLTQAFALFGYLGGGLFFLAAICGGALTAWLAITMIKRSSTKNTFFLAASQEGFVGTDSDSSLVGKRGIAVSDLGPSGFALIDSQRVQVVSDGRYIEKGTSIVVEASRGGYFIVKSIPRLNES